MISDKQHAEHVKRLLADPHFERWVHHANDATEAVDASRRADARRAGVRRGCLSEPQGRSLSATADHGGVSGGWVTPPLPRNPPLVDIGTIPLSAPEGSPLSLSLCAVSC